MRNVGFRPLLATVKRNPRDPITCNRVHQQMCDFFLARIICESARKYDCTSSRPMSRGSHYETQPFRFFVESEYIQFHHLFAERRHNQFYHSKLEINIKNGDLSLPTPNISENK